MEVLAIEKSDRISPLHMICIDFTPFTSAHYGLSHTSEAAAGHSVGPPLCIATVLEKSVSLTVVFCL